MKSEHCINASYSRIQEGREILKDLVSSDPETMRLYSILDPSSIAVHAEDVTLEILLRVVASSDAIESVRKGAGRP